MAAGMAANRPTAVAISASEMPGPTARRLVLPCWPRSRNARMMPSTVPNSPMNGVTDAVVASQFMLRSSLASSSLMPSCRVRSSAVRLVTRAARFHLPLDLFVAEIEDGHQRRGAELLARHHDGFQAGGLAERAQEARVGLARAAQGLPLGKNHGPGIDGKTDQNAEHGDFRRAAALDHFPEIYLKKEGNRSFESNSSPKSKSIIETRGNDKKTALRLRPAGTRTHALSFPHVLRQKSSYYLEARSRPFAISAARPRPPCFAMTVANCCSA